MKKLDPFSGIPAVPNSIAGQWLAFSHMANHYRKLLNVKPRVNSSAPCHKTGSTARLVPSLSSYLKGDHLLPKKSTTYPKLTPCVAASCTKQCQVSTKSHKKSTRPPEYDNSTEDSSPQAGKTKVKRVANKSIKNRSNKETKTFSESQASLFNNYQTLYGPSSLKSSTDCALHSDDYSIQSPPEEPRVETMGVAEKIKAFLDNLHEFDGKSAPRTSRVKKKPALNNELKSKEQQLLSSCSKCGCGSRQKSPVMTTRESRHSNCFIPIPLSPMGTPRPSRKLGKKSTPSCPSSTPKKVDKMSLSEAISKTKAAQPKLINGEKKKSLKQKDIIFDDTILGTGDDKKKRYLSGASTGSVGTIRGSEELATEVTYRNSHHGHNEGDYHHQVPTRDGAQRDRSRARNASRTRTPSAGYCSLMSSSATGSGNGNKMATKVPPAALPIKNKDSSRDSAYYGFSSGESRITTRESTPEKLAAGKKHVGKRSLGDRGGVGRHKTALSTVPSSNFESTDKEKKKSRASRLTTDDKYLNFLTEVTEDIVNRGIYTNRGLKMLFQDHLDGNKELDLERMTEMLEKLRMDLGIPKDDTLNKLEFGYGSVLNSDRSGTYSRSGAVSISTPRIPSHPPRDTGEMLADEFLPPPQRNPSQNPFFISEPESESEVELHSCKSETSLSESELQRTLKEVGIDSRTTLEIVSMIKHNPSNTFPNSGRRGESSGEEGQVGGGGKKSGRRHSQSCSTPPTSHCSTMSS